MASRPSPFSREQANEHVREIRRRKCVDDLDGQDSDNMRDLDRTLNIFSDQLYEKETHFLLELIQNLFCQAFDTLFIPVEADEYASNVFEAYCYSGTDSIQENSTPRPPSS